MKSKSWLGTAAVAVTVLSTVCFLLTLQFTAQRRDSAVARFRESAANHQVSRKTAVHRVNIGFDSVSPASPADNDARALYRRLAALVKTLRESNPNGYESCRKYVDDDAVNPLDCAEAQTFIGQAHALILDIRRLASLDGPYVDANTQYKSDGSVDLTLLAPLCDFEVLVCADARVQSRRESNSESVRDLISAMRLADTVLLAPCVISQRWRYDTYRRAFEIAQEMAQSAEFSVEHARALVGQLPPPEGRDALATSLVYLSSYMLDSIDSTRGKDWLAFYKEDGLGRYQRILMSPIGRPALDLTEQAYADAMVKVIDAAPLPYYEAKRKLAECDHSVAQLSSWRRKAFNRCFGSLPPSQNLAEQATYEAMIDLVRLGLSLQQYQLKLHSCPASLEVIVAELGAAAPLDPFSGKDYVYQVSGNSFTLRSVGLNGVEDSGFDGTKGDDIVWRGKA